MRIVVGLGLAGMMLAACDSPVPNSAAGVGFGDYQTYLRQREAELQGRPAAAPVAPAAVPPAAGAYGTNGYGATPVTSPAGQAAARTTLDTAAASAPQGTIGAEALAALKATAPASTAPASPAPASPAPASPAAPLPAATGERVGAPLDAMSAIGSARPAPIAEVTTAGAAGPNLAAYALAATNTPGQRVYERGGFKMVSEKKACARFISPDLAQIAFLEKGGPVRDPANLDADGDGFACGWDPRPFQAARR